MDLSAIYSKTPKGLRARAMLIGGLSSHLMKVLTHVDGSSSAETILLKFNKLTPQQLIADLTRLEQEGYIRPATVTSTADDSWSITVNFEPMVVEEFQSEEELEVSAQAKTAEQTRQIELEQAKQEEERRLAAQLKADKIAHKLRDKEKIKAETKVIAQLEQERLALEAARREAEAEAQLKARQEAERIEQQQAEERAAKLAEETRLKAELKAREVAEQAEAAAKENARRESERISREAEEAQKKADIEAKAKQESERLEALNMAKAAEDARQAELKAQAEYQAQLEQAAKAAAEQRRVEVEAAAQAEEDRKNAQAEAEKLETKRQLKAEQDARAQAERKAKEESKEFARQQKLKAQAEEKAKAEASEQAQLEAARIAKETEIAREIALENERLQAKQAADALAAQAKVEQTQRLERENQVQLAAEAVRAHLLADEYANLAAKQNAQLEMERIGREADQAYQKAAQQHQLAEQQNTLVQQIASAQQHFPEIENSEPDKELPVARDFDAAEAAEEAAFETEERAAEAEIGQTISQATVEVNKADIRNAAKTVAAAMASIHDKARSFVSAKKIKQWLGSFTKVTFIYVPVLLLLVLLVLNFINLSFLIKPIEQMASESIGETVGIKKVHASLWPQPHLVLEDVAIGTGNNIEAVHVLPVTASLFEEVKVVKSLVIEGLNIEQANFSQPLQWASNASKAKRLKVEQINLKNLTLVIRDLQLESFDGKVTLTDAGALSSIELVSSNNALSVKISPQGNDSEIVLKATNWALPFNQKIVFGALNAKGLASQYKLNFSQIEGEIFGGNLTGQANIEWPDDSGQWLSAGEFKLSNANTEAILKNFGSAVIIDGKLVLDARFSGKAREVSKLASNTITDANFDVRQGSIQRIELVRGVLSPSGHSLAGDNTNFDKLTGSIKLNQNQYQFGKLVLVSSQFNAYGFINIDANQILTGKVHADLVAQSRHLKANFGIIGRGEDLKSN